MGTLANNGRLVLMFDSDEAERSGSQDVLIRSVYQVKLAEGSFLSVVMRSP